MGKGYNAKKANQEIIDIVVDKVSMKIFDDFTQEYNKVISDFYDHCSPNAYDRTGSLFKASNSLNDGMMQSLSNCFKRTSVGFEFELIIDPKYIPGEPYYSIFNGVADKSLVFQNAFVEGYHGNELPGYTPTRLQPSPKEAMDDWYSKYSNTFKRIVDKAYKDAFKEMAFRIFRQSIKKN